VFNKIGTPLYFCNNILITDIPNCSAENLLGICDTVTYLTFKYSLKIARLLRNGTSWTSSVCGCRWRTVWTQDVNIYHFWYFV